MSNILRWVSWLIATCGGLGRSPKAPGTIGSLGGALTGYYLLAAGYPPEHLLLVTLALFLISIWAVSHELKYTKEKDPSYIVIDEWVALWLVYSCIPLYAGIKGYLYMLAFVLFRLFDITKIGGVGYFERWPGWAGIMCDDIGAALWALIICRLLFPFF